MAPRGSRRPQDRLGRLADAMTKHMVELPEFQEEKAIVLLTAENGDMMTHSSGYGEERADSREVLTDALTHVIALCRSVGLDLQLVPIGKRGQG